MALTIPVSDIVEKSRNPHLQIHPSWKRVLLGDIAEILNGAAFKSAMFDKKEGYPLIRIRDIGKNSTDVFYDGTYDSTYVVEFGDLLIGMDGDFNCARWGGANALLNQRVCKVTIVSRDYDKSFINIVLPGYLKAINEKTSSVTVKHLSSKSISEIPLPLPPLPEQHRIVTKIEELFTKLDAGVESLKKTQGQLMQYRQSVLKSACEGKLVPTEAELARTEGREYEPADVLLERILKERRGNWEEEQKRKGKKSGKYKEPAAPDVSGLYELPEGWTKVSIAQISYFVTDGDHNPPKRIASGIPHLTAKNVINWQISEKGCTYISVENFENVRKRYEPLGGDIIITCVGTIGRTAIVPDNYTFSADRNLAAVRLVSDLISEKFFLFALNTTSSQKKMNNASGSTAQPHLYLKDIRSFIIPIPPLAEQHRIVAEVERRLSVADEIEKTVEQSLKQAQRLRQSILKKAFEGKLVPQNPDDEPASVLLERIKEEKVKREIEVKNNKKMKPKKKKVNQMEKDGVDLKNVIGLHEILKSSAKSLTPIELWQSSKLEIDDFYAELKTEVEKGRIIERRPDDSAVFLEVNE